eukprot:m.32811 g.32811  ORF g.32811 m.32811 type:complete len:370 (+) comp6412_c0_seq1:102-1211(+)
MEYVRYHGLGNDYIVITPHALEQGLKEGIVLTRCGKNDWDEAVISRICHRNFGVGSDGILFGPLGSDREDCNFKLRIFNPDGTEAEKSGNGLRIFTRFLFDEKLVEEGKEFSIETLGGVVTSKVLDGKGSSIRVTMGTVSFANNEIPMLIHKSDLDREGKEQEGNDSDEEEVNKGKRSKHHSSQLSTSLSTDLFIDCSGEQVLNKFMTIDGVRLQYCCATVGNPHCIIIVDSRSNAQLNLDRATAERFGPLIETNFRFPNKTNVQFLRVLDRNNIQIEIWERGAGYTLASGSSSTACACVAVRLGLCDGNQDVTVHMPGGTLSIGFIRKPDNDGIDHLDNLFPIMTGPVTRVCKGVIDSSEMFEFKMME